MERNIGRRSRSKVQGIGRAVREREYIEKYLCQKKRAKNECAVRAKSAGMVGGRRLQCYFKPIEKNDDKRDRCSRSHRDNADESDSYGSEADEDYVAFSILADDVIPRTGRDKIRFVLKHLVLEWTGCSFGTWALSSEVKIAYFRKVTFFASCSKI